MEIAEPEYYEEMIEEDHPNDWAPRSTRVLISIIVMILYPVLLIVYYFNREELYTSGEKICDSTSKIPGKWLYWYVYFFANYFDRLVPIGGCFLLMVGVDKAITLKVVFVLMFAMHSRNILRNWFEDNRPLYTSANLKIPALICNCSFGMPSGHVEGTTTLWTMLLYVCMLHSRTLSRLAKFMGILVVAFTQLSMVFAMMYTGRHTIYQGLISLFHTGFWLSFMCVADPAFTKICRGFLNGDVLATIKTWAIALSIYIFTSAFWLIYLEPRLFAFNGNPQIRCFECRRHNNLDMRLAMTKGFAISASTLGITTALTITRAKSYARNDSIFWDHFSCEGICRLFFLFLLNMLNFNKIKITNSGIDSYMFASLITFSSAFIYTLLFPKITQCLKIKFKGDFEY